MTQDDEAFAAYINYLQAQADGNVGERKEKYEELILVEKEKREVNHGN